MFDLIFYSFFVTGCGVFGPESPRPSGTAEAACQGYNPDDYTPQTPPSTLTGVQFVRIPVLLLKWDNLHFSGAWPTFPSASKFPTRVNYNDINNMFNQPGYAGFRNPRIPVGYDGHNLRGWPPVDGGYGSVKDYFYEISQGKLWLEFVILNASRDGHNRDPLTPSNCPNDYAYKMGNRVSAEALGGRKYLTTDEMVRVGAAIRQAKLTFNKHNQGKGDTYDQYLTSTSPSGIYADLPKIGIESLSHLVIFTAAGEAATGTVPGIWAHASLVGDEATAGERWAGKVYSYGLVNLRQWNHLCTIGIIVHELGHSLFGLPDLYDTSQAGAGIGSFCGMAGGSWGRDQGKNAGILPERFCAWALYDMYRSGFSVPPPDNISVDQDVVLKSIGAGRGDDSYKIITSGRPMEYFMIEYRDYDSYMIGGELGERPGSGGSGAGGLLIWHIDDNQSGNSDYTHKLVDLEECADAGLDLGSHNGKPSNCWPSRSEGAILRGETAAVRTTFSNSTNPNTKWYDGTTSGITISNISHNGDNVSFTVSYS